jgi:hypothetical protein
LIVVMVFLEFGLDQCPWRGRSSGRVARRPRMFRIVTRCGE